MLLKRGLTTTGKVFLLLMALSVIFAWGPLSALAVADETATDTEQTTGSDNDATSNDADDDLQATNDDASDDEEPLEEVSGYVVEISIPNVISDAGTDVTDDDADSDDNGDDANDGDDDGATDDDATDNGDDDDDGATDDDATDDGDDDGDSYITVRAEDGHLFILAVAPNVAIQAETTEDGDYIISIGDFVELELADGAVTQIAVITEDEDEGDDEDEDADEGEGDSETKGSAMAAATGVVASVSSTITIATPNGGEYTYNINDSTKVFAGPDNLSVDDIEEGDMVTVKGDGEGGAAWVRFVGKSVLAKRTSHPVFGKGIGDSPADDDENGEDEDDDDNESEIQTKSGNRSDKDKRPGPARGKGKRGR